MQLFRKDFGLEAHFQTRGLDDSEHTEYSHEYLEEDRFESRVLYAYLILPATYGVMRSMIFRQSTSLHAARIIDASTMKEPTEEQKSRFKKATRILGLQLDVRGGWTEGRPTSERYRLTNHELGRIKDGLAADGTLSRDRFGFKDQGPLLKKLECTCDEKCLMGIWLMELAMEWPQLIVFVSGTLIGESIYY